MTDGVPVMVGLPELGKFHAVTDTLSLTSRKGGVGSETVKEELVLPPRCTREEESDKLAFTIWCVDALELGAIMANSNEVCNNAAAIFHLATGSTEAGAVRRAHRATGCLAAVELCGWQLVVAIRAVEAIIEVGGSAAEAVD